MPRGVPGVQLSSSWEGHVSAARRVPRPALPLSGGTDTGRDAVRPQSTSVPKVALGHTTLMLTQQSWAAALTAEAGRLGPTHRPRVAGPSCSGKGPNEGPGRQL